MFFNVARKRGGEGGETLTKHESLVFFFWFRSEPKHLSGWRPRIDCTARGFYFSISHSSIRPGRRVLYTPRGGREVLFLLLLLLLLRLLLRRRVEVFGERLRKLASFDMISTSFRSTHNIGVHISGVQPRDFCFRRGYRISKIVSVFSRRPPPPCVQRDTPTTPRRYDAHTHSALVLRYYNTRSYIVKKAYYYYYYNVVHQL